jgi:hypothetical protein
MCVVRRVVSDFKFQNRDGTRGAHSGAPESVSVICDYTGTSIRPSHLLYNTRNQIRRFRYVHPRYYPIVTSECYRHDHRDPTIPHSRRLPRHHRRRLPHPPRRRLQIALHHLQRDSPA